MKKQTEFELIPLLGVERNYLPITGQLALNTDTNKTNKIVLVTVTLPLEPLCRSLQAAGAVGILASSVGGHFF
jgi:hypothetical protein